MPPLWNPYEELDIGARREQIRRMAGLERRFPGVNALIEHTACLAAAELEGKVNVRRYVGPSLGGWVAYLTAYSPDLEGCTQRFSLHGKDGYPARFPDEAAARAACDAEEPRLVLQLLDERSRFLRGEDR